MVGWEKVMVCLCKGPYIKDLQDANFFVSRVGFEPTWACAVGLKVRRDRPLRHLPQGLLRPGFMVVENRWLQPRQLLLNLCEGKWLVVRVTVYPHVHADAPTPI